MTDSVKFPFSEILKSIPGFFGIRLEQMPKHTVVEALNGGIEIRGYAPALLAQVHMSGDHDRAVDEGFDRLAGYIFGANADGEKMSMTNPVYHRPEPAVSPTAVPRRRTADGTAWTVAFFLGNDMRPDEAPVPNDAGIELVVEPEHVAAVLRYTGNDSADKRADARQRLLAAIAAHPRWRIDDTVVWAQYDAPFTLPFVKRNEAQVAVKEAAAQH